MIVSIRSIALASFVLAACFLVGCASLSIAPAPFRSVAYAPTDPEKVEVRVSLNQMNAYVVEGDRVLLATPVTIGTPSDPTPLGEFKVFRKLEKKRSYTYGFHVHPDGVVRHGTAKQTPKGSRYVGYPMPYWVEFHPGYGFHSGGVWPQPRSHGCLRVHPTVAPKFFALCRQGTPVHIAPSQPEDATIGQRVVRPTDYADPDPAPSVLITDQAFTPFSGDLFEPGPAPLRS